MIVRPAVDSDIPALCEIAKTFIDESAYGWRYSAEVAEWTWRRYLAAEEMALFVVADGETICGGAVLSHDRDFTLERIGYVVKFYILPEYRMTKAPFLVCAKMAEWFDRHLCWAAFATSTANIGPKETEAYTRLMARYGFVECGPTLMRKANG